MQLVINLFTVTLSRAAFCVMISFSVGVNRKCKFSVLRSCSILDLKILCKFLSYSVGFYPQKSLAIWGLRAQILCSILEPKSLVRAKP